MSIVSKDLRQVLSKVISGSMPDLAYYYLNAIEEVFGTRCHIGKNDYATFLVLQDDLHDLGIKNRDYAYTVVRMLRQWALYHKMKFVPMRTFCGDWALRRYNKVFNSATVTIMDHRAGELLNCELLVARMWLQHKVNHEPDKFDDVIDQLKPFLTDEWLEGYGNGHRAGLVEEAVEILRSEYRLHDAWSYDDIAKALNNGQV
jgi:hypothetical protein